MRQPSQETKQIEQLSSRQTTMTTATGSTSSNSHHSTTKEKAEEKGHRLQHLHLVQSMGSSFDYADWDTVVDNYDGYANMDWPPEDEQQDGGDAWGHSLSPSEEDSKKVDEEEEDDTYDTAEEPEEEPEPADAQKKRATTREPPYNPPRPPQIKIRLHFRAGKPKERTRKRNDLPDDKVIDYTFGEDGYSVLRAKIKA
ncbi:hypothetical protein BGZ74_005045, partial [Mortierella antarctica]